MQKTTENGRQRDSKEKRRVIRDSQERQEDNRERQACGRAAGNRSLPPPRERRSPSVTSPARRRFRSCWCLGQRDRKRLVPWLMA